MNILILGGGGREEALAWKIKQSPLCSALFRMKEEYNDFQAVKKATLSNNIDLIVVGPEEPLVLGLRDKFEKDPDLQQVMFIGPSSKGALLEGSKEFAKLFMQKYKIPTAAFKSFTGATLKEADKFLESLKPPYVLKADGLAAGKGVVILDDLTRAKEELRQMFGGKFNKAGQKVVIEQFLKGIEVSVFILTDGKDYLILPEAKDYKRIGGGDTGLNTGGMGAVSPVPFATKEFMQKVENKIIKPTLKGLQAENIDYKGFIFFGLISCDGEPYVIEYNVRMGDPETEAVMTRIDSDLLSHLGAVAKGKLSEEKIKISKECALTVVCVSGGYPESYKKGVPITIDYKRINDNVKIFRSGVKEEGESLTTSGGRVFAVTANSSASTFKEAILKARLLSYDAVENINYEGKYFRKDIGLDVL